MKTFSGIKSVKAWIFGANYREGLATVLIVSSIPLIVLAQSSEQFAGKWSGTVMGDGGKDISVEVTLAGTSGTYRTIGRAKNFPCIGKEFPLQLVSQTEGELKFEVKRSVLPGCADQTFSLHSSGEKSLEGSSQDGLAIKLSR